MQRCFKLPDTDGKALILLINDPSHKTSGSSRPSLLGPSYCQLALVAQRSHCRAITKSPLESLHSDSFQIPSLLGQLAPFGSHWYRNHGTNCHTERGWLSVGSACWALSLGLHLVSSFKKYVYFSTRRKYITFLNATHRVPRLEIVQSACLVFLSSSLDFGLLLGIEAKCPGLFPVQPIVKKKTH